MISILDYDYNDEKYDLCDKFTVATLNINGIKIPLCMDCLKELETELHEFNTFPRCYCCKHFVMSESGWEYGGSCAKDTPITQKDAGYINYKDCMDTCKDFGRKEFVINLDD